VAELREFAGQIATEAGKFAALGRESALRGAAAIATKSAPNDLVTSMDRACEQLLRERVHRYRPRDSFLGEESAAEESAAGESAPEEPAPEERPLGPGVETVAASGGARPLRWIVDPIDGTVNYVRDIPAWCVSVAVWDELGPLAGAIYVPPLDRLYSAGRGLGSTCNGVGISVSTPSSARRLILATGFSYDPALRRQQHAALGPIIGEIGDIRRSGSAGFDLCQVASGLVDLYYESSLSLWDLAAGVLIADEAGARSIYKIRGASTGPDSTGPDGAGPDAIESESLRGEEPDGTPGRAAAPVHAGSTADSAGSYGIASGSPFAWDLLRAQRWDPIEAMGLGRA
jgi:fructose-1,6-bisphosphatase/inositol monophosphatase family enzyme